MTWVTAPEIKLGFGDCLEMMQDIPHKSVNLVLADPPYGTTLCKWDSLIPLEDMWDKLKWVVDKHSAIVLMASQPYTSKLIMSNPKMFRYTWVWEKNCPSNIACGNIMPMRYTEDVCVFYTKQPTFNKRMISRSDSGKALIKGYQDRGTTFKLSPSNVSSITSTEVDAHRYDLEVKNPSNLIYFGVDRSRKYKHPSKKPVDLMKYLISTYTNEGDTVLDFTMGSGTTGVACRELNRTFIGIEKDPNYFEMACNRIIGEVK